MEYKGPGARRCNDRYAVQSEHTPTRGKTKTIVAYRHWQGHRASHDVTRADDSQHGTEEAVREKHGHCKSEGLG